MKHGYRLRDGDQVPTRPTTVEEIMSWPTFALGVADVRAGREFRAAYESWADTNDRWNYERGRAWACVTQRNVVLKRNGKVTDEAIRWFVKLKREIL
jgi:hypothetical protein